MQCFDLESIFCRLSLSEQIAIEASERDNDLRCVFVLKMGDCDYTMNEQMWVKSLIMNACLTLM